jgi:hypothetical protein
LEVTITAIHRTIAGKIDDKIIAADLAFTTRTFFEKIAFVPSYVELALGSAEAIRGRC